LVTEALIAKLTRAARAGYDVDDIRRRRQDVAREKRAPGSARKA
jgi:hypothetical protein